MSPPSTARLISFHALVLASGSVRDGRVDELALRRLCASRDIDWAKLHSLKSVKRGVCSIQGRFLIIGFSFLAVVLCLEMFRSEAGDLLKNLSCRLRDLQTLQNEE